MTPLRATSAVAWVPWSHAAFQRAHDEQKLVLLSLSVAWSAACREMDRECYADPAIVDEINRWFIPIRVDADRRPDIAERYELGGLPTTGFLDANGEVLGGGTFVPPERLIEALRQARRALHADAPVSPKPRSGDGGPSITDEDLVDRVFAAFDTEHAGFGSAPKFPLVAPVHLAIDLFRDTQADTMADYATRTLEAMAFGGLYDEAHGGFYQCASRADWQDPQPGKTLATNAGLLKLYLHAGVALEDQRWLARAADILEFVQTQLAVGPGAGWRASTDSDDTCLSDANAVMASAALMAAQVFDDASLRQLALQAMETVLLASYRPGAGAAHHRGGPSGLLADNAAMAAAHLDAWDVTGDDVYRMMAQERVEFMRRALWRGASFADRPSGTEDVGRLTEPLFPFVANCEAAEVLHRLSCAADEPQYADLASRVLETMRSSAPPFGPLAAHYLIARRALSR